VPGRGCVGCSFCGGGFEINWCDARRARSDANFDTGADVMPMDMCLDVSQDVGLVLLFLYKADTISGER
jgi:hypothetical protein